VKSAWDAAADATPKSDQKRNMSERSELVSLPDFGAAAAGTRRAAASRSLFFAYFLWRDKESKWQPGHPRLVTTKLQRNRFATNAAAELPARERLSQVQLSRNRNQFLVSPYTNKEYVEKTTNP
jgi:hypothetical protein